MPEKIEATPPESPFATVLAAAEEGRLRDELDLQLKAIVAALHDQQRNAGGKPKAGLTLAIAFTLDSGIVEVVAKVKADLPKPPRTKSIFFRGPGDSLSRQNPRQTELPGIRDVSSEGVRDIRTATQR